MKGKYFQLSSARLVYRLLLAASITIPGNSLASWSDNIEGGARSSGVGNASVTIEDFWGINNNQAGINKIKNICTGLYSTNHFLLKELTSVGLGVIIPTHAGVFGFSVDYSGYNLNNSAKAAIAYGKAFGAKLSAGIKLDFVREGYGESYGAQHLITFEVGFIAHLTERFCIGFHTFNPIPFYFDHGLPIIPSIYRLGLSYQLARSFTGYLECEQITNLHAIIRAGFECSFNQKVYGRIGIIGFPYEMTVGLGFILDRLEVDIASSFHQYLGYSPQISFIYFFK